MTLDGPCTAGADAHELFPIVARCIPCGESEPAGSMCTRCGRYEIVEPDEWAARHGEAGHQCSGS